MSERRANDANGRETFTRRSILRAGSSLSLLATMPFGSFGSVAATPNKKGFTTPLRLDQKCIGHIRRFADLANQPEGEWGGMGDGAHGWFGVPERTLRYQLANMAYALASVQYNRTPAYREIYQKTLLALFNRLLEPDCWKEWINVSRGGSRQDPQQKELNEGWVDPIKRHNVMYGGHILEVGALYDTLYRENRFIPKGSIRLAFSEGSWGFGNQVFEYDLPTISKIFYDEFVELNFEGFPCEPTLMFPECPQHAVLGMMSTDNIMGTSYSREVRTKYFEQFKRLGYVDNETKSFHLAYRRTTKSWLPDTPMAWADGWTGTFMHAWAPEYIESLYPAQRDRHLPDLLDRRRTGIDRHFVDTSAGVGYVVGYASEVGDVATVDTLLDFADSNLGGVWRDGRYFYPRNDDTRIDDRGVLKLNSALQGNALIPFGRLNVQSGLWRLHNEPWTLDDLKKPHIVKVDYEAAGVAEAFYDAGRRTLSIALLPGPLSLPRSSFEVIALDPKATYQVVRNGVVVGQYSAGTEERDGVGRSIDGLMRLQFDPREPTTFKLTAI